MKCLSKEQVLLLHQQLIERYGGTHGVRDEGLLDSASRWKQKDWGNGSTCNLGSKSVIIEYKQQ